MTRKKAHTDTTDFRLLFEAVPDLYWVVRPGDYRIVAVSDAFLACTQTRREDVVGHALFDVFPGNPADPASADDVQRLRRSLAKVESSLREDRLVAQRYTIPRRDADGGFEVRYWTAFNKPVLDESGELQYILHRTEDVTEQVRLRERDSARHELESRAEQMETDIRERARELDRLNRHLAFAQKVACLGSWEYDPRDGSRTWSDELYRILGRDRESHPENEDTIGAAVHPEDRDRLADARRRALAGEITEFEHRIVRPDGEVRYVQERAELVRDEDGSAVRLFGTIQDITEQKRAQERLRQSEHLLQVAGQMARLGAWQLDVASQRITWSDEVFRIHDMEPRASITLEEATRHIAPESRERILAAIDKCQRDGTPYDEIFRIITAKGRHVWARAIGNAVLREGEVACIQGAVQDITEQRHSQAEIETLSERFTETMDNISDGFAMLDTEWRITYVNSKAEQIIRQPREEVLGQVLWDVYPELTGTLFERVYRQAQHERRTASVEDFFEPLRIWVDLTAYPVPNGLAVLFRDVTERRRIEAVQREQAEQTRLIVENTLDAVINIDTKSVVRVWNRQAENIFGWRESEALGRYLYDLIIPPEYRDAHRRGLARFLETGEGPLLNNRTEVIAQNRKGERFPVELAVAAIRSDNSWIFSAFVRDITERKRAEEAARINEERFRTVARVATDTVWDWDLLTDRFWWSDGIETVFGYDREDVGTDFAWWKSRVHPEDRSRVVAAINEVIKGNSEDWRDEYRFLRKNGTYAFVVDRGITMRDSAGRATRMIGGMNDASARKAYENRLAQQAALLDKAREAIIVLDLEGRVTYWNKAAERMYGWTRNEALGRSKQQLLREDHGKFEDALKAVRRDGEWTSVMVQQTRTGEKITVEAAWSLVTDDNGKPSAIFSIINDISERLALEEQLRQSQRLESIGQLTGGVAHDFNNLLTVILGNAELLADQLPADSPLRRLAEMSRDAAERGSDLTHRLLAFARRQALAPQAADVNELVRGMESLLGRTLPENIRLEFIPGDVWPAYVDPAQLESVLLNLALNAKDAMPKGGMLTLETANAVLDEQYAEANAEVEPGDYVLIAVSDTGTGIDPEIVDRVFDPFFTTKEKGKGTGLGLSMAYGFAKQSSGHIKIYSEPGEGTTVRVYLPRAMEDRDHRQSNVEAAEPVSGAGTVLVVEDDDMVREHASRQLEMLGYDVIAASNGPEALEVLEHDDVDLLFTDVIMSGGMNGAELAAAARQQHPELKVLYTSGYTENAIVHHGHLDHGVHLLQKPYQRADLARAVSRVLAER